MTTATERAGAAIDLPGDLQHLLGADAAHARGITGRGVRVVLLDSGFQAGHEWFAPYRERLRLDPGDPSGHGTASAAMLLSVAPDVELTGLSLSSGRLFDQLARAVEAKPDVLVLPFVLGRTTDGPGWTPPNGTSPTEAQVVAYADLIERAAASGTVVVAAAGNAGTFSATASHPSVVSAGGATVLGPDQFVAGGQTAHFASRRFAPVRPDVYVPEVCGVCGPAGTFQVPSPPSVGADTTSEVVFCRAAGGDPYRRVWGGSGGAAAQVGGVVALIRQRFPGADPERVRHLLRASCRPLRSKLPPVFATHSPPHDAVTGFGLVDADAATK